MENIEDSPEHIPKAKAKNPTNNQVGVSNRRASNDPSYSKNANSRGRSYILDTDEKAETIFEKDVIIANRTWFNFIRHRMLFFSSSLCN